MALLLGSARALFSRPKVDLRRFDSPQTFAAADFGLEAQRLTLTTGDGLRLVAHEVPVPEPKAVVILLAGIHMVVTSLFGHARMLADHGYASILLEMRAHGESEGNAIALGFHEPRDVRAAVDYIRRNPRYAGVPIVVLGLSMGGAVAINATGLIPEIAGFVSLSAYSGVDDLLLDGMGASGIRAVFLRPLVRLLLCLKYGWGSRHNYPRERIRQLGERPALLVHSKADSQVSFANFQRLVKNAPPHVETWVREGDMHVIVAEDHFLRPAEDLEYAGRILGFLDRHFSRRRSVGDPRP